MQLDHSGLSLKNCSNWGRVTEATICKACVNLPGSVFGNDPGHLHFWGVAKGSSISWVAKLQGHRDSECKAVKWVVAKLQGDKTASFCRKDERMRSYRVTNQHPNLPWNFMTHGFLDPSAFPDFKHV